MQINPTIIVDIARESKSFTVQIRISSLLREAARERDGGEKEEEKEEEEEEERETLMSRTRLYQLFGRPLLALPVS